MFFEIVFREEHKVTATASYQTAELVGMIIRKMLLQLVCMQALELTHLALQLLKINVRCTHRYTTPVQSILPAYIAQINPGHITSPKSFQKRHPVGGRLLDSLDTFLLAKQQCKTMKGQQETANRLLLAHVRRKNICWMEQFQAIAVVSAGTSDVFRTHSFYTVQKMRLIATRRT